MTSRLAVCVLFAAFNGSPAGAAPAETTKAFCEAHPMLDFPDATFYGTKPKPGVHPREVAAIEASAIHWRCMDGRAFVCDGGAADAFIG